MPYTVQKSPESRSSFDTSTVLRCSWAGLVSILANAALLVVQQCCFRMMSPLIGSSIETWSWIIAAFLLGIAGGNWLASALSARVHYRWLLPISLLLSAVSVKLMPQAIEFLANSVWFQDLPLFLQIAFASMFVCFVPGMLLSLVTVPTIQSVAHTSEPGAVAGRIFAWGTAGSLAGNYAAGFWLLAHFGTHAILLGTTATLFILSLLCPLVEAVTSWLGKKTSDGTDAKNITPTDDLQAASVSQEACENMPQGQWPLAILTVASCSFVTGALEGAAFRVLAPLVGVSLILSAGVVGVVLTGMALGNRFGGRLASANDPLMLRKTLIASGASALMIGPLWKMLLAANLFAELPLILQTVCWSFSLFFAPSFLLGTISPQVIQSFSRQAGSVSDVAGRLCAWSTLGCIAGILATAWIAIEQFGAIRTCILAGIVPLVLSIVATRPSKTEAAEPESVQAKARQNNFFPKALLVTAALLVLVCPSPYLCETRYFAINVNEEKIGDRDVRVMVLDRLVHSAIDLNDPSFLHYPHEKIQGDVIRWASELADAEQRPAKVLIIGGGGYSLPRWIESQSDLRNTIIDVVEIDPGVTQVAHDHLGLSTATRIQSHHMDGRQFVRNAEETSYDVIIQDAVNDFSVPSHLMTLEYNQLIRRLLRKDGVYLLTVIDSLDSGIFVASAAKTMDHAFPETRLMIPKETEKLRERSVFIIASTMQKQSTDLAAVNSGDAILTAVTDWWSQWSTAIVVPIAEIQHRVRADASKAVLLTDDYAPVDQLMMRNFLD